MDQDQHQQKFEREHVQQVYEAIAPHFSATRYKPWPVVDSFLKSLPLGSLGADVGCGNGKYLGVNKDVFTIGSDMSHNLIKICKERGHEAMVCDNLDLPYRPGLFDFIVSIAVIHHFSTPERRKSAVQELTRVLKPNGRMLIFVWAMEQQGKRKFDTQDVFVPWTMNTKVYSSSSPSSSLSSSSSTSSPSSLPTTNTSQAQAQITTTAATTTASDTRTGSTAHSQSSTITYQRYYHMFVDGELDDLVRSAGGLRIDMAGYDRDNWYVICTREE